jgi:aminoglycoside phosphotransferase (APT) family kinase protein
MDSTAIPAVGGNRLRWDEVDAAVQREVERGVGATVIAAESRDGGFSPGLASVLTLADGRRVFAKAINASRNDFTPGALRTEMAVLAALPESVPAPRLHWSYDDGEWVVLIIDAIDGHTPRQPWVPVELDRFLHAATVLARSLTPAPIPATPLADLYTGEFTAWRTFPGDPDRLRRLDAWTRQHLAELVSLEAGFAAAVSGDSLLHGDFRADNVVFTDTGFVVVDWPSVVTGAPWIDLLLSLPSVSMHGGGELEPLWRNHPLAHGVDPDAVNAVLAGAAGFFMSRSHGEVLPLLPTIRQFQRAQGIEVLRWLAARLGWRPYDWSAPPDETAGADRRTQPAVGWLRS